MRRYEVVKVDQAMMVEHKCDVCGLNFLEDEMESQECFYFYQIGGYSSIFGDGVEISIDLCQHCFNKKLGDYCNTL